MKIKIDEDLPRAVTALLRSAGFIDTLSVVEQGMGGWKDPRLWHAIQEEGRFLVTADKGFADIRRFPPGTHAGVLLLRPDADGVRPYLQLLTQVLSQTDIAKLQGGTTVATSQGLRTRVR